MQTDSPLVSIVIPVYNGANFLREAVDSALAQTYKNVEILLVNDGSTDNGQTHAIARDYGDRIRYFCKENGGCASALNVGIANMNGHYFSWLSHDDVYLPDKIEHQVSILRTLDNPNTIIYSGYEVIDEHSRSLSLVNPGEILGPEKQDIPLYPLLRGLIHGCSLLIPVNCFRTIGVFDESLRSTHDYALWFEFLRSFPIRFDGRLLIKSRLHPDQGTNKLDSHLNECDALWSSFLTRLTQSEMSRMEGTPYLFLRNTADFLAKAKYDGAKTLAASMADLLHKSGASEQPRREGMLAKSLRSLRDDGIGMTFYRILRKVRKLSGKAPA